MNRNKMDCHAATDIGEVRPENEDHFLIADLVKAVRIQSTSLSYDDQSEVSGESHGKVLLVADGMGGHAAGRRASTLAVDETINYMVNRMQWFAFNKLNTGLDDPEVYSAQLSIGDTLLLCTDGLTKHVSDDSIAAILRRQQTAEQTCDELVEMANAGGGSDNITVLVARFTDNFRPSAELPAEAKRESSVSQPKSVEKLESTSNTPTAMKAPAPPPK